MNAAASFRPWLNRTRRQLWRALFGRMLFGERSLGVLRPATRLSPTVLIEHEDRLQLADDVFVGHFVFIETWPDRTALDLHCATEHFRRLVPQINAHQRDEGTFILMDAFVPFAPG